MTIWRLDELPEQARTAVVGTGEATMRLRTGDRVRVNRTQGTVERLED